MAELRPSRRSDGFSLVEMLVALVFTMLLMAGMAAVFKASLSTLFTSGESLSSARRNRMSIDLLGSDLDSACMYLQQLSGYPPMLSAASPAFYIEPNMPIANLPATALPTDPTTSDQLFFYLDLPLAFQGKVSTPAASNGTGAQNATAAGNTFVLDCGSNPNALAVCVICRLCRSSSPSTCARSKLNTRSARGSLLSEVVD